jgi:hypothetical protein
VFVAVRFSKSLVVLALAISTGAHWGALQTVAWTAMLANNLRTYSIAKAMARTFDGKHPCRLCKVIAAGRKSEPKAEPPLPVPKFEFPLAPDRTDLKAPDHFTWLPTAGDCFAEAVLLEPPTPPPRCTFI